MIEKILVCNIAYLGDVILTTAALPAIKKAYPKAKIGFLTSSWSQMIIEDHQLVDWIHIYDHPQLNRQECKGKQKSRRGRRTWALAISELIEKKYDIAFDFYSVYKGNSGSLLSQAQIPVRVGFWPSRHYYFFNHRVPIFDFDEHIVRRNERLLNGFGLETKEFAPFLRYHQEEDYKIPFKDYILIHMGAGRSIKKWPLPYWEALLLKLSQKNLPFVFLGKGEKENQEIITVSKSLKNSLNLCDQISWKELFSLMKKAKLLIGNDSMAGHLAAVCQTKAVLIYTEVHIIERWRPFHESCHVVFPKPEETFKGDPLAPHKVTVEDVLQKVLEIL